MPDDLREGQLVIGLLGEPVREGPVAVEEEEEELDECGLCGDEVLESSLEEVTLSRREVLVCEICARDRIRTCEWCSHSFDGEDEYSEEGVCRRCAEEVGFHCDRCSELVHLDGGYSVGDCCYCQRCGEIVQRELDEEDGEDEVIRPYETKVSAARVSYFPPEIRLFGIEIEVECKQGYDRGSAAELVSEVLDDLPTGGIIKSDGSLQRGFEIVSEPMTLLEMMYWLERLERGMRRVRVKRQLLAWQTSSCGLHVHVRKCALSDLMVYKMDQFLNDPVHRSRLELLGGRELNSACNPKDKKQGGKRVARSVQVDVRLRSPRSECGMDLYLDRYSVLNLVPKHTVELRFFRGTINVERLQANVQFCDALAEYCRDTSIRELDWGGFKTFVMKSWGRRGYRELAFKLHRLSSIDGE